MALCSALLCERRAMYQTLSHDVLQIKSARVAERGPRRAPPSAHPRCYAAPDGVRACEPSSRCPGDALGNGVARDDASGA